MSTVDILWRVEMEGRSKWYGQSGTDKVLRTYKHGHTTEANIYVYSQRDWRREEGKPIRTTRTDKRTIRQTHSDRQKIRSEVIFSAGVIYPRGVNGWPN